MTDSAPLILQTLLASIGAPPHAQRRNVLATLIAEAERQVSANDVRERLDGGSATTKVSDFKEVIVEAMRGLIATGVWQRNTKTGRIWRTESGTFVLWPLGARDIGKQLGGKEELAFAQDPNLLAQRMQQANLILSRVGVDGSECVLWEITPPGKERAIQAIKLVDDGILWPETMEWPQAGGATGHRGDTSDRAHR